MDEGNKIKILAWVTFAFLAVNLVLNYICLCHIRNYGRTIDSVECELKHIAEQQREVTEGLGSANSTASDITDSISSSQGALNQASATTERLDEKIRTSGEIIRECQSILAEVERSGAKENK